MAHGLDLVETEQAAAPAASAGGGSNWVTEEAGLPYKTLLLELGDQDKPDYRALQPFRSGADP
jgi:hypothetical protein